MENREGIPRRQFVKEVIGGGVATALLAEFGFPQKVLAQLEEILKIREFMDISFDEGIKHLQGYVWNKEEEHFWIYLEKGDKRGWIDVVEKSSADQARSINIAPLFEDRNVKKLYFAHTHPSNFYSREKMLPEDTAFKLAREKRSNFPLPPGADDILSVLSKKLFMNDGDLPRHEMKHYVVDPTGIWEYDVDENHPAMKKIVAALRVNDQSLAKSMSDRLLEWRREIVKQGGLNEQELDKFQTWAKQEYGISFSHRRVSN